MCSLLAACCSCRLALPAASASIPRAARCCSRPLPSSPHEAYTMAQEAFDAAAAEVKTWTPATTPSNEDKLKMYGLFKQATVGDVNIERPAFYAMEAKAKWDAWKANEGMDKEAAMTAYVTELEGQKAKYS